jgi:hypothetical protein
VIRMLALGGILSACAWTAQETVENPEYKAWASFKPGSYVTLNDVQDSTSIALGTETTLSLLDLNADRALLEVKTRTSFDADIEDLPPREREIPAFVPRGQLKTPSKDGIEEISVRGRKFLCHWVEEENEKGRIRTWNTVGVPGGVVRRMITLEGPGRTVTVQEATLWKSAP